ncbi:MAG: DUF4097 domain-containing protein [Myxococcales bacterium]|nr:DUF4097 domain-containing protein [Myxococcales bacterium]
MHRQRISSAFLLALLLLAPPAQGADLEETVAAEPGGRLVVELGLGIGLREDRGALEVIGHDEPVVAVETETTGWGADAVEFTLERDDTGVRLAARVEGATSWLFGGPRVEVRIRVPRPYDLDLRTTAGPVRVQGTQGNLRIRSDDGDVELREVSGEIKVRVLTGSVEAADVSGALEVKTADGELEIAGVDGELRARTTLGDIDIERVTGAVAARAAEGDVDLRGVEGPIEVRTGSGAIRAGFRGNPRGAIETVDGGIDVSFPTAAAADLDARGATLELGAGVAFEGEHASGQAVGALGGGGDPLWLRATTGRIRLSRR